MAQQLGDLMIVGTLDGITYYELDGQYYARAKSSLTRKKVKNHPAFERTRASYNEMAKASPLASLVYRAIPNNAYWQFQSLVSLAKGLVKEGKNKEEVLEALRAIPPNELPRVDRPRRNTGPEGKRHKRAAELKKVLERKGCLDEEDLPGLMPKKRRSEPGFTGYKRLTGCADQGDLQHKDELKGENAIARERLYYSFDWGMTGGYLPPDWENTRCGVPVPMLRHTISRNKKRFCRRRRKTKVPNTYRLSLRSPRFFIGGGYAISNRQPGKRIMAFDYLTPAPPNPSTLCTFPPCRYFSG